MTLVAGLVGIPYLLGVFSFYILTHPACGVGGDPGYFNSAFESVRFISDDGVEQSGYFIPGTNSGTILQVPAYGGGRGAELHYAEVFNQLGYSVLTFSSRVCVGRSYMSLGYQEVADVVAAYAYLQTRADVDSDRVGLWGFSSAGATAMMALPRLPRVRSVAAAGGYHDFAETMQLNDAPNFVLALYHAGAAGAYRLITGDDVHVLSPISAIDQFDSRPLLLVYGSLEVSLDGAELMLQHARETGISAELWVVPGADHGNYLSVAREAFVERLGVFYRTTVLDAAPAASN
jgi:dipeptidyl aminopeptidase/acylaminoacyl peptidase